MVELKSLTSYELVETLVASASRPAKDLDRAISNKEAAKIRQRANQAGLPIADEYGMSELVFVFTDGIGTWHEDLSQGWDDGFEKRLAMQQAYEVALQSARAVVSESGNLVGWQLEKEARKAVEAPSSELAANSTFNHAREQYLLKRNEYILEFGTVHSHIYARQQQLQTLLDGITQSRSLPRITLEFKDARASLADYVRGANVITLNNHDLTLRSRAPFVVSLIAGQLATSFHDTQIVRCLVDQLQCEGAAPPTFKTELGPEQNEKIRSRYFEKTGSLLSHEYLDDVARLRGELLSQEETERAEALLVAFKATIGMLELHESRAAAIASFEQQSRKLRQSNEKGSEQIIFDLYKEVTKNSQIVKDSKKSDNPWKKVLSKLSKPAKQSTATAKEVSPAVLKAIAGGTEQKVAAGAPKNSETNPASDVDAAADAAAAQALKNHRDEMAQLCKLIDDGIEALRQQQKEGQDKFLQYVHAREAVVFSKDAYSLALTRLSPKLKYTGPKIKKARGMEDACVHHDEHTYLDVHGM